MVTMDGKHLESARLNFFCDLPSGARRDFQLTTGSMKGAKTKNDQIDSLFEGPEYERGISVEKKKNEWHIDTGTLIIFIPEPPEEEGYVAGPIVGLDYGLGPLGYSAFSLSEEERIVHVDLKRIIDGKLFQRHRFTYTFESGATYIATVDTVLGYPFVRLSENMIGFTNPDQMMTIEWAELTATHRYAHAPLQTALKLLKGQEVATPRTLKLDGKTIEEDPGEIIPEPDRLLRQWPGSARTHRNLLGYGSAR